MSATPSFPPPVPLSDLPVGSRFFISSPTVVYRVVSAELFGCVQVVLDRDRCKPFVLVARRLVTPVLS